MIYNHYKSKTQIIKLVLFRILLFIKDTVFTSFLNFFLSSDYIKFPFQTFRTLKIVLYLVSNIRPSSATFLSITIYIFEYHYHFQILILVSPTISKCILLSEVVPLYHERYTQCYVQYTHLTSPGLGFYIFFSLLFGLYLQLHLFFSLDQHNNLHRVLRLITSSTHPLLCFSSPFDVTFCLCAQYSHSWFHPLQLFWIQTEYDYRITWYIGPSWKVSISFRYSRAHSQLQFY